ncbi:hypothetical protein DUNSADRAFT_16174, partial [Dunaliella salina]
MAVDKAALFENFLAVHTVAAPAVKCCSAHASLELRLRGVTSEEHEGQATGLRRSSRPLIPLLPEDLRNSLKCNEGSTSAHSRAPSPNSLRSSRPTSTISSAHSAEQAMPLSLSSASLSRREVGAAGRDSGPPQNARMSSSSLFSGDALPAVPHAPQPSYTPRTASPLRSTTKGNKMHTRNSSSTTATTKSAHTAAKPPLPTLTHSSSIAAATAALPSSRRSACASTATTPRSSVPGTAFTATTAVSEAPTRSTTPPQKAQASHASGSTISSISSRVHGDAHRNTDHDPVRTAMAAIDRALSCPLPPPHHSHIGITGAHPSTSLTTRANSHTISPASSFPSSPSRASAAAYPATLRGGTLADKGSVLSEHCLEGVHDGLSARTTALPDHHPAHKHLHGGTLTDRGNVLGKRCIEGVHDGLGARETSALPTHHPVHKPHHQGHSSSWSAYSRSSSLVPEVTMGALPTAQPLLHSHSSSLVEHSQLASNPPRGPAGSTIHCTPSHADLSVSYGPAGFEGGAWGGRSAHGGGGSSSSSSSTSRSFKFSDQPPYPASFAAAHRLSNSGISVPHNSGSALAREGHGVSQAHSSGASQAQHSTHSMQGNPAASALSMMGGPVASSTLSAGMGVPPARSLQGGHLLERDFKSDAIGRMHSAGLDAGGRAISKASGPWGPSLKSASSIPVGQNAEYRAGVTSLRTAASANQLAYDSWQ